MAKTQIDLSDIVLSPEFMQEFKVIRKEFGKFVQGRYEESSYEFTVNGVISATDEKTIQMVPEGDRNSTVKTVHTIEKLFITREDGTQNTGTSDYVIYNDESYKLVAVVIADDYGYYKSIISKIGAS